MDLRVYSEFQRVDPFGRVVAADRAAKPREILSPAVARNAWATFHVAVTTPRKTPYFLAVQTNPRDILRWKLYAETFVSRSGAWIPDVLEEMRPPYFDILDDAIEGQNTKAYLLDVWTPGDLAPGVVRLEVLAKAANWVVWPMEVRVQQAVVPDLGAAAAPAELPDAAQPADASVHAAVEAYLEGKRDWRAEDGLTVRAKIRRNAIQDMALAGSRTEIAETVRRAIATPAGAEWYLKVRDSLLRMTLQ